MKDRKIIETKKEKNDLKPLLTSENIFNYLIQQTKEKKFTLTFEQLSKLAHDLWLNTIYFYLTHDENIQVSDKKIAYWETTCFFPYESLSEEQKDKDRKIILDWLYKNKLLE